jgi:hypothetical protein
MDMVNELPPESNFKKLQNWLHRLSGFTKLYLITMLLIGIASPLMVAQQTNLSSHAANNIYYVAKNGSDSNPGSETSPWLTIQKAAKTMVAGDTVFVKAGVYNERVVPVNSGTEGNPITYKNFGTDKVILDGTGVSIPYEDSGGLFQVLGPPYSNTVMNYIIIDGFEVRNVAANAGIISLGEAHHITIRNCYVHDIYWIGIGILEWTFTPGKVTDITIDNCEVARTNLASAGDEALTLKNVTNFEVKNCKVHDTPSIGIGMADGTTNGSIHNNEVYNAGEGIYIDTREHDADSVSIYNNLVHNNDSAGIELGSETGTSRITNCNVYNNIVWGNQTGFSAANYEGGPTLSNFYLTNNTFYNSRDVGSRDILIQNPASKYSNSVIRNNIIMESDANKILLQYDDYANGGITIDHNLFYEVGGYASNNKFGTNYIQANPQFVNLTSNFQLQTGSPAIDAGSSSNAPGMDYTGAARPQGTGYDIGAYEFGSSTGTTITCSWVSGSCANTGNRTQTCGPANCTGTCTGGKTVGQTQTIADTSCGNSTNTPACIDTGLQTPTYSSLSVPANTAFTVTCPANGIYDCIDAYVDSAQCTWISTSPGAAPQFTCPGQASGTHTLKCQTATAGTTDNCCAGSKSLNLTIASPATPTLTPTITPTPTAKPTSTPIPTSTPTPKPTSSPTPKPTNAPTPTLTPTLRPTSNPTPTVATTAVPTVVPTRVPTPTPKPNNFFNWLYNFFNIFKK